MNINEKFPYWKKHTDTLINIFYGKGWKFGEERPEIVFSDKLVLLPENKNGLHGSGILKSKDNDIPFLLSDYKKKDSGFEIIIYTKVLEITAKDLETFDRFSYKEGLLVDKRENSPFLQENGNTPDYGMEFQQARENLFYCALINETAKWILADVEDANGNIWKESPLDKKDHLHECLTALFTYWVVNSNNIIDLTKTFYWVFNKLHNGNYSKYKDFINENIGDVIDATEIARVENFEFVEIFKLYVELISGGKLVYLGYDAYIKKDSVCQDIVYKHFHDFSSDKEILNLIHTLMNTDTKHKYRGYIRSVLNFGGTLS